eukprot:7783700-Lingulodinium_polyedra.AAC.1
MALVGLVGAEELAEHLSKTDKIGIRNAVEKVFPPGDPWTAKAEKHLEEAFPWLVDFDMNSKFAQLVGLARRIRKTVTNQDLPDFLEFCSGAGAITRGVLGRQRVASCYDIVYDKHGQDMLHPLGWRNMILMVVFTKEGAVDWSAPECKSWVFMSRHTSKRKKHNW